MEYKKFSSIINERDFHKASFLIQLMSDYYGEKKACSTVEQMLKDFRDKKCKEINIRILQTMFKINRAMNLDENPVLTMKETLKRLDYFPEYTDTDMYWDILENSLHTSRNGDFDVDNSLDESMLDISIVCGNFITTCLVASRPDLTKIFSFEQASKLIESQDPSIEERDAIQFAIFYTYHTVKDYGQELDEIFEKYSSSIYKNLCSKIKVDKNTDLDKLKKTLKNYVCKNMGMYPNMSLDDCEVK